MKGVKVLRDQRSNKKVRLSAHLQRWQLRVSTGEVNPEDGKRERKFRTFRGTEAQAEVALRAFIAELESGLQLDSQLTVSKFADCWLAEKERDKLAGRTLIRYESIIRCYIKPTPGRVMLADLSLADVKRALHEWRTGARKDRWKNISTTSESTIHHVFTTLSNLCESAVIDRKTKENPCRFLKRSQRPRKTTPEIAAADADTALTMLELCAEPKSVQSLNLHHTQGCGLVKPSACHGAMSTWIRAYCLLSRSASSAAIQPANVSLGFEPTQRLDRACVMFRFRRKRSRCFAGAKQTTMGDCSPPA